MTAAVTNNWQRMALWTWALTAVGVLTSLMATHSYALPRPAAEDPRVQRAVFASLLPAERGRFVLFHVLYSRCRCSQRILEHLFERGASLGAAERIVLVGAHAEYERRARAAGYSVETLRPEQLQSRYALSAAPALLVATPSGSIGYLGGYSERKQGLELRDREIFESVRGGSRARELPLFGCAVSQALKDRIDPLGLRSVSWGNSDDP